MLKCHSKKFSERIHALLQRWLLLSFNWWLPCRNTDWAEKDLPTLQEKVEYRFFLNEKNHLPYCIFKSQLPFEVHISIRFKNTTLNPPITGFVHVSLCLISLLLAAIHISFWFSNLGDYKGLKRNPCVISTIQTSYLILVSLFYKWGKTYAQI